MTTIRTTCPRCGEVDMGPDDILLSVLQGGREGTYRFTCPTCFDDVEKRADRKIVALLVSAGVDVAARDEARAQAELDLELQPSTPQAPPFTVDDLIDFHFRLENDAYIRDFLASQR